MKTLKVDNIRIDGGTQAREEIDNDAVKDYRDILTETNGDGLPPIEVYFDGSQYWLSDGFHRWHAHKAAGFGTIQANVIQGTQRDAILAAVGANAAHGLKRSNADKRKAVRMLLEDGEWQQKSDRWIADKAKVSAPLVASVREASTVNIYSSSGDKKKTTRTGKDGKKRKAPKKDDNKGDVQRARETGKVSGGITFDVEEIEEASILRDDNGTPIPKHLKESHEQVVQINSRRKQLDGIKRELLEFAERPGCEMVNPQVIDKAIKDIKDEFHQARFHVVCPYCHGDKCDRCKGWGYFPHGRKNHLQTEVAK